MITLLRLPDVITLPTPTFLCLLVWWIRTDYCIHPPELVSCAALTIRYIQAMTLPIHVQGMFNNHTTHSLYKIIHTVTSVMVGDENEKKIAAGAGIEPTSLVSRLIINRAKKKII